MSTTSATSPTSPIQHRDIRSASKPFKRDKDHDEKWSMGQRPSGGVTINYAPHAHLGEEGPHEDYLVGGSERQREKVRPQKQWSQMTSDVKSHPNKTKPTIPGHQFNGASGRVYRKVNAVQDANDHNSSTLSKSLLELLPTHVNNTNSAIQTAIRAGDEGILYSFDNNGKSPGQKGREVDLGGLVEQAEMKFLAEQTDRIVKGEYEVIDDQGETTALGPGKKGRKGSPKQRSKNEASVVAGKLEDDDGFELI